MWWIFPIIIIVTAVAIIIIKSYRELQEAQELKLETANNLGKTLSMRYDVMQEMLELAEGYLPDENRFIVKLLQVKLVPIMERFIVEDELMEELKELIYQIQLIPEIDSSRQFNDLKLKLGRAEKNIHEANTYLNEKINDYNKLLVKFPNNIVSKLFKFRFSDTINMQYITR